jgi:hypothetical protein
MKTTFQHGPLEVKLDTALPVPVLIHKEANSVRLTADEVELVRDILNTIIEIMESTP